ncbi:hypothetical protein EWM64_g5821 [Hericium alpestre]|uniref:3-oxoacyl-[acyl-carrier-protein] reductase n=1 Tax=Hericium alpestre TaxID=135208 RepID=A0A4Y9ZVD2_9AGAM|nr:hypothetical protein EWM64_g5821 [Hericium alpestre]
MASKGVALITGAAQGIGRAIALRLAGDGFNVALNDVKSKASLLQSLSKEIEAKGRKAHFVTGDISVEDQVKQMVGETASSLGSLDVMVANAAMYQFKPLLEMSVQDMDQLHSVNVRGLMLCYKHAATQMIGQGHGGRIIGATSVAGRQGFVGHTAYCAAKYAVRGVTQVAAAELGKHDITVNAYAPGLITTEMLDAVDTGMKDLHGLSSWVDAAVTTFPIARRGTPEEVASLVSFLASRDAGYITGQTYDINGGSYYG